MFYQNPDNECVQDVYEEQERHRTNRENGKKRHSGRKLGAMTVRKGQKQLGGLLPGSKKAVARILPKFFLKRFMS